MSNTTKQNEKASAGQKQRYIETVWEVATYDVWGNEREGFEVNDVYRHGSVELRTAQIMRRIAKERGTLGKVVDWWAAGAGVWAFPAKKKKRKTY